MNHTTEVAVVTASQNDLANKRQRNIARFESTLDSIYSKYARNFDHVADEIDIETGEIVVNRGHLERMRHEYDVGINPDGITQHPPRTQVWEEEDMDDDGDEDLLALEEYMRSDDYRSGTAGFSSPASRHHPDAVAQRHSGTVQSQSNAPQYSAQTTTQAPLMQNPAVNEMLQTFTAGLAQQIAGFVNVLVQQNAAPTPQIVQNNVYIGDHQRHSLNIGDSVRSGLIERTHSQKTLGKHGRSRYSPNRNRYLSHKRHELIEFETDPHNVRYHDRQRRDESPASKRRRLGTPGAPSIWADIRPGRPAKPYNNASASWQRSRKLQVEASARDERSTSLDDEIVLVQEDSEVESSEEEESIEDGGEEALVSGIADEGAEDEELLETEAEVASHDEVAEDDDLHGTGVEDTDNDEEATKGLHDQLQAHTRQSSEREGFEPVRTSKSAPSVGDRFNIRRPSSENLPAHLDSASESDSVLGDHSYEPLGPVGTDHDQQVDAQEQVEPHEQAQQMQVPSQNPRNQNRPSSPLSGARHLQALADNQTPRPFDPATATTPKTRGKRQSSDTEGPKRRRNSMSVTHTPAPGAVVLPRGYIIGEDGTPKIRPSAKPIVWQPEEDAQLLDLKDNQGLTYKLINDIMPNHSVTAIFRRYAKLTSKSTQAMVEKDPNYARTRWDHEEDARLLELKDVQHLEWDEIAQLMPGRSQQKIVARYYKIRDLGPSKPTPRKRQRRKPKVDPETSHIGDTQHASNCSGDLEAQSGTNSTGFTGGPEEAANDTTMFLADDEQSGEDSDYRGATTSHARGAKVNGRQPTTDTAIQESRTEEADRRSYSLRKGARRSYAAQLIPAEAFESPEPESATNNAGESLPRSQLSQRPAMQPLDPAATNESEYEDDVTETRVMPVSRKGIVPPNKDHQVDSLTHGSVVVHEVTPTNSAVERRGAAIADSSPAPIPSSQPESVASAIRRRRAILNRSSRRSQRDLSTRLLGQVQPEPRTHASIPDSPAIASDASSAGLAERTARRFVEVQVQIPTSPINVPQAKTQQTSVPDSDPPSDPIELQTSPSKLPSMGRAASRMVSRKPNQKLPTSALKSAAKGLNSSPHEVKGRSTTKISQEASRRDISNEKQTPGGRIGRKRSAEWSSGPVKPVDAVRETSTKQRHQSNNLRTSSTTRRGRTLLLLEGVRTPEGGFRNAVSSPANARRNHADVEEDIDF